MLKYKRLIDYKFPYAIFVSKLIDYFEVDTTNERNEIIKAASEIDKSILIKMVSQGGQHLGVQEKCYSTNGTWSIQS